MARRGEPLSNLLIVSSSDSSVKSECEGAGYKPAIVAEQLESKMELNQDSTMKKEPFTECWERQQYLHPLDVPADLRGPTSTVPEPGWLCV